MSTLITRVGGFKFVIRNGLAGAYVAQFEHETGDVMALPYELRSTYECPVTYPLILAATNAVEELDDRVTDVASRHQYDCRPCDCEACGIFGAIFSRVHMSERMPLI